MRPCCQPVSRRAWTKVVRNLRKRLRGEGREAPTPYPRQERRTLCGVEVQVKCSPTSQVLNFDRIDSVLFCQVERVRRSDTATCRDDGMPRPPLSAPGDTIQGRTPVNKRNEFSTTGSGTRAFNVLLPQKGDGRGGSPLLSRTGWEGGNYRTMHCTPCGITK